MRVKFNILANNQIEVVSEDQETYIAISENDGVMQIEVTAPDPEPVQIGGSM